MSSSAQRARLSTLLRLVGAVLLVGFCSALLLDFGFAAGSTSGVVTRAAASQPPARALGFLVVRVPQGKQQHAVFAANVLVSLQTASGKLLETERTDLSGRFELPELAKGSYRVCWSRPGFVAACGEPFTMAGFDRYLTLSAMRPSPGTATFWGHAAFADGSNMRTFEPMDNVDSFATVTASIGGATNTLPPAFVNDYGEYVLAGVPAHADVSLRGAIEKAKTLVGAGRPAGSSFRRLDVTVQNRPPTIAGLVPTTTGGGGGENHFTIGPATTSVSVRAVTADANDDTVKVIWTLPDGTSRPPQLATKAISFPLRSPRGNPSIGKAAPTSNGTLQFHALAFDGKGGYASDTITLYPGGTRFSGTVRTADGSPLGGATVTVGNQTTTTTSDGRFQLSVTETPRHVLTITKEGFMPVSEVSDQGVTGGEWTLVRTIILPRDPKQEINVVDDRHTAGAGARVVIPANSLVSVDDGKPPTGNVNVAIATVDPGTLDGLPGDGTAVDAGKNVGLLSYGGAYIEITDAAGKRYNLKPGATAAVTVPVPKEILDSGRQLTVLSYATAPTNAKQRNANPQGLWAREGTARRSGNAYVATVPHFSFVSLGVTLVNPACIRLDAVGMPQSFDLQVTTHDPVTLTPVTTVKRIENGGLRFHLITTLPPNDADVELRAFADGNPIELALPDKAVPKGLILKANSGPAATTAFPSFPYTACHGFSGAKPGPLPSAVLVEADVPDTVVNEFLYLNGDGNRGVSDKAANLTSGPDEKSKWRQQAVRYYQAVDPLDLRQDVTSFRTRNHFGVGETTAAYGNSGDLGFGREMHCQRHKVPNLAGFDVACYVTNYGNKDTDDEDDFIQALTGLKTGDTSQAVATVGMEYSRIEDPSDRSGNRFVSNQRVVKFYVWVGNPKNRGIQRVTSANLDGFGARPVPQLCAVCHGGHYEGPRRKDGTPDWSPSHANLHSNFIAFDLRALTTPTIVTGSPPTSVDFKATQQAAFKRLNKDIVLSTLPGRPIRSLIERMYPGTEVTQNENVQVPGWSKKTGSPSDRDVYRDVIAPSCRTCHYSQDSTDDPTPTKTVLDWDQASELGQRAVETAIFVCNAQLMPHALITHRRFWLSDAPKQKRILRAFLLDHKVAPAVVKTCR